MTLILTAEQMRRADAKAMDDGISAFELMQRAGKAVANAVLKCRPDSGRIVIVAGGGNNGGDGYAAAVKLSEMNVRVTVVALVDPAALTGAAGEHARLAEQSGAKIRSATGSEDGEVLSCWLSRAVLVVDALFGIGLSRPLQGWMLEAVKMINASDRPVLSVDIASGVDSDSGKIQGAAIRADWTLPIAATKWGHWLMQGRACSGEMLPHADIGISDDILNGISAENLSAAPHASVLDANVLQSICHGEAHDAHKGDFGHAWIFGGSIGFGGAPRLAALGAMVVHAGLVSLVCRDEIWPVVAAGSLETMVHRQQDCDSANAVWKAADALLAGPGWGRNQQQMLAELLASDKPLVLDADALNMLVEDVILMKSACERDAVTVFTPHPGEAARLLGCETADIQVARPAALLKLVDKLNGWVVLKGAQTLIASPDGRIFLCPFGSNNLARAGSGDVLAGMIAGLLARGSNNTHLDTGQAIAAAVVLHAKAGERNDWYRAGQLPDRAMDYLADYIAQHGAGDS